jgi:hypothetical protein
VLPVVEAGCARPTSAVSLGDLRHPDATGVKAVREPEKPRPYDTTQARTQRSSRSSDRCSRCSEAC